MIYDDDEDELKVEGVEKYISSDAVANQVRTLSQLKQDVDDY